LEEEEEEQEEEEEEEARLWAASVDCMHSAEAVPQGARRPLIKKP
jgi:hypothetical protein